eukprot:827701-Amphidinium_carterae.1
MHKDGNKTNNTLSNLAYASAKEIAYRRVAHSMRHATRGRSVIARAAGRSEWLAYASFKEASEALGVAAATVSRVCHGKIHSRRFEAKFLEAPDLPDERWVPLVDASKGKIVP